MLRASRAAEGSTLAPLGMKTFSRIDIDDLLFSAAAVVRFDEDPMLGFIESLAPSTIKMKPKALGANDFSGRTESA
jgi:hypothetical protein